MANDSRKSGVSVVGRAAIGAIVLGPIGLLAGATGKNKQTTTFQIIYKVLIEEEKEFKTKRKEIQEKLIKFATRIPIFVFLSDSREETLKDVITKLEPDLFKRVTGLLVKDFELLVSLGLFKEDIMNEAVYKFIRGVKYIK